MMKNFDFIKFRKTALIIAAAFLAVGLLFNIIFGVELDISFKGGTLLKYSYEGNIDKADILSFVTKQTGFSEATVELNENGENGFKVLTISLTNDIDSTIQTSFINTLTKQYPNNGIKELQTNSLQASYGRAFFAKCLVAVALASLFLVIYVGFRFRRIGGVSAGVMALLALLNDILIAYFAFVVFRIPLNDNFVAVVLAILGYSLNGTLVIYDRIRENRKKMDKKCGIAEIVNLSLNQSFTRNVMTSLCVLIAIGTVAVVAMITSLESIISFAIPMTFGVVAGFFSSTFLCTPVWVLWVEYSEKRAALKGKAKKAKR